MQTTNISFIEPKIHQNYGVFFLTLACNLHCSYKDAKDVSSAIVKTLHTISIVMFGSVAMKGSGEDLDLLIGTEDTLKTLSEVNFLMSKYMKPFNKRFAIAPFVIPLSLLREYYLKRKPVTKIDSERRDVFIYIISLLSKLRF